MQTDRVVDRPILTIEGFEADLRASVPEVGSDLDKMRAWWGEEEPGLTIRGGGPDRSANGSG